MTRKHMPEALRIVTARDPTVAVANQPSGVKFNIQDGGGSQHDSIDIPARLS